MAFLGYDPDMVVSLRRAVRRCSDQLALLRSTDPEAIDAMRTLASSRTTLDVEWQPVLDGLLGCTALQRGPRAALDWDDLRLATLIDRQQAGWMIVTDPLAEVGSYDRATEAEAATIGRRLQDEDDIHELSTDELLWLADRLRAIERNPAATDAFRSEFADDSDWAALLDRIGLECLDQSGRAVWDPEAREVLDRIDQLDALLAPLAHMYAAGQHSAGASWYPYVIEQLDPYSAALVLSQLLLQPGVAAVAADEVLQRWLVGNDKERMFVDQFTAGDNAADLLFRWLADDAETARQFVIRASAHPELLFRTTHQDASIIAVLIAGTGTSDMSVGQAGTTIRPLLDWARQNEATLSPAADGGVRNIRSTLAAAVAPWLMQVSARTDDWSWSAAEGDDALHWVIEDEQAAATLLRGMQVWLQTLTIAPLIAADGRLDSQMLDDLATLFATVQVALHDEEVSDSVAAGFLTDATFLMAQILVSAVVPVGPAGSVATDLTLAAVSPLVQRWLQRNGMIDDADDGIAAADARLVNRSADTAVLAVVGVVGQLIDAGKLPPDTLDSLTLDDVARKGDGSGDDTSAPVGERLHAFVRSIDDGSDPLTFNALDAVIYAFTNPMSEALMS